MKEHNKTTKTYNIRTREKDSLSIDTMTEKEFISWSLEILRLSYIINIKNGSD